MVIFIGNCNKSNKSNECSYDHKHLKHIMVYYYYYNVKIYSITLSAEMKDPVQITFLYKNQFYKNKSEVNLKGELNKFFCIL